MLLALALPCGAALADVATAEQQVQAQQLDAAEATLRAHLAGQPDDTAAQFLLARVLSWRGRPEQALPIYRRLLQQQADNADYLLGEGQALLWAGHPQRALESLERAAQLAPDYAEVQQVIQQARAALTVPSTAAAPVPVVDAATRRRHELEISARQDWLDSGFDNWRSQRLDYASTKPESLGWYGALTREQRFGEWGRRRRRRRRHCAGRELDPATGGRLPAVALFPSRVACRSAPAAAATGRLPRRCQCPPHRVRDHPGRPPRAERRTLLERLARRLHAERHRCRQCRHADRP